MITIRRSEARGHFNHGWLQTWHTFSFADYRDPAFMGFSELRVINQDIVQPGQGFGTHGHKDMEIITWVLDGLLEHQDSMGNGSKIRPGDAQYMSAGTGVTHSEFNGSEKDFVHLLQMWILPEKLGTPPRYDQRAFPEPERRDRLCLLASPDGEQDSIIIGQEARMYAALLAPDRTITHETDLRRSGWIHVARGRLVLNDQRLGPGDGAAIRSESRLVMKGEQEAELILFDLP